MLSVASGICEFTSMGGQPYVCSSVATLRRLSLLDVRVPLPPKLVSHRYRTVPI
jgi:hypothetical protein